MVQRAVVRFGSGREPVRLVVRWRIRSVRFSNTGVVHAHTPYHRCSRRAAIALFRFGGRGAPATGHCFADRTGPISCSSNESIASRCVSFRVVRARAGRAHGIHGSTPPLPRPFQLSFRVRSVLRAGGCQRAVFAATRRDVEWNTVECRSAVLVHGSLVPSFPWNGAVSCRAVVAPGVAVKQQPRRGFEPVADEAGLAVATNRRRVEAAVEAHRACSSSGRIVGFPVARATGQKEGVRRRKPLLPDGFVLFCVTTASLGCIQTISRRVCSVGPK